MEKDDSILKFQRPGTNFHTDNSRPIITVDPRLCPLPETLVDSRMVLLVYCEREAVGMERDCRRRKERGVNEGQRRQGEREQTNTHTTLDAILQPTFSSLCALCSPCTRLHALTSYPIRSPLRSTANSRSCEFILETAPNV